MIVNLDSKITSVERTIDYLKEWNNEEALIKKWEKKLQVLKEARDICK